MFPLTAKSSFISTSSVKSEIVPPVKVIPPVDENARLPVDKFRDPVENTSPALSILNLVVPEDDAAKISPLFN
ncbi:hypothetical protein D3C83_122880 [compost metagenome]